MNPPPVKKPLAKKRTAALVCIGAQWVRLVMGIAITGLAACGAIQPATPGHEPPSGGQYNPVSHEMNDNGR